MAQLLLQRKRTVKWCQRILLCLFERCRIRYKVSVLAVPCSIHLSRCIHAKPSAPCPCERRNVAAYLEHQCSTLGLLVTTVPLLALRPIFPDPNVPKFEVLASLQRQLCLRLARRALQSQYDLLRCLGLLVENGFCLTTITGLFAIISTLSLGEQGSLGPISRVIASSHSSLPHLSSFVLCDLVLGVLPALLALAVCASGLGYVDLRGVSVSFKVLSSFSVPWSSLSFLMNRVSLDPHRP